MSLLKQPYTLNNGVVLPNRVVMAPITTKGASWEGKINEEDISFFGRRSAAAGMLITGATSVSQFGEKFSYQQSVYDDTFIPGLKSEAKAMKSSRNKAILQLYHAGINAETSIKKMGKVIAPSVIESRQKVDHIEVPAENDVWKIVTEFVDGAKRALEAGFDGIEIHGGSGHLVQQFFSPYSNKRNDYWGGTLKKRMHFPLEIITQIQREMHKNGRDDFIIGYRLTPVEQHENEDGYGIQETLALIEELCSTDLTYIHVNRPEFLKQIRTKINNRSTLISVPHATNVDEADAALSNLDLVGMARELMAEPDFSSKLEQGIENKIVSEVNSEQQARDLAFPRRMLKWMLSQGNEGLVPKGRKYLEKL